MSNTMLDRPLVDRQPRRIRLPPHSVGGPAEYIYAESLVVIGANGSGKTRFGLDIESNCEQPWEVYRIAAQKMLEVPDFVSPTDADAALRGLWFGYDQEGSGPQHRHGSRYAGRPATVTLNDFQRLLQALLSDEYQQSTKFLEAVRSGQKLQPPDTLIERLKRIWHSILPHRTLRHVAGKFEVLSADSPPYHSKEMSDGERVLFYLVGQTLCAPANGLVIVDEPELHLHRAVQSSLWDAIEAERPDCTFVYLTHDVDFAASRRRAEKIALSGFDGQSWKWNIVPRKTGLPDAVLLEVLGHRKPTLFVEGVRGGLDDEIYRLAYPHFDVKPVGGWQSVVAATKAFNEPAIRELHQIAAAGIVDLDHRTPQEIESLRAAGVHCLGVAQIENVLLQEKFLHVFSRQVLAPPNSVQSAQTLVLKELRNCAPIVSITRAEHTVDRALGALAIGIESPEQLEQRFSEVVASVDVKAVYADALRAIGEICDGARYADALRIFKRKGLSSQISACFGLRAQSFTDKAIQLLRLDKAALQAIRDGLPTIS